MHCLSCESQKIVVEFFQSSLASPFKSGAKGVICKEEIEVIM